MFETGAVGDDALRGRGATDGMLTRQPLPLAQPIAPPVKAGGARRRANNTVTATEWLPVAEPNHEIPPATAGRRRANCAVTTKGRLPVAEPIEGVAAPEEREAIRPLATMHAAPLAPTITALIELQRQRLFCIKSQSRCDRSTEAFIARFMGFKADADEKDRKEVFARATALRRAVEKGGHISDENHVATAPADGEGRSSYDNQSDHALSVCTPIILNSAAARKSWDDLRTTAEKQMRKLAKVLPVYAWAETVKGFGDLGVAIIVGETGDLANYATKEGVWKRLGLAVIDGERQQRRSNVDEAAAHGYSPRRRAEIWTLADSLFKHQWRGDKDEDGISPLKSKKPVAEPACATGPYGAVYGKRKTHTEGREGWTSKRRDNDARRIMTKALVEDIWRVWNGKPPLAGNGSAV